MALEDYGFSDFYLSSLSEEEKNLSVARVICRYNHIYRLTDGESEFDAQVSGKLKFAAQKSSDLPSVGDFVLLSEKSRIDRILPRKTLLSRKSAGDKTDEQALCANMDKVFIVSGLDGDYNLRRIERFLTAVWDSGAEPVVVLNKADLFENAEEIVSEVEGVAVMVPVLVMSAKTGDGIEEILHLLPAGKTAVFLGSSGVGKSSIINALFGEEKLTTGEVSDYRDRGKHTTTHRELFLLPGGSLLIDTPGIRELQFWSEEGGVESTFSDIEALAENCRFRDCTHVHEPGCAVLAAVKSGDLDEGRYVSYLKQREEMENMAMRKSESARHLERKEGKKFAGYKKSLKYHPKRGDQA